MTSIIFNLVFIVFAVLIGAIALLLLYSRSKHNYWKKLNIKYLQPVPLFGNVLKSTLMLNCNHETYDEMYKALGDNPYGGYYELDVPFLMVKDPKLLTSILVKDFKRIQNRDRISTFAQDRGNRIVNPLSKSLPFLKDEKWKALRQKMVHMFTSSRMTLLCDMIIDSIGNGSGQLYMQMKGQNCVDVEVKQLLEDLTMQVIISCIFGSQPNFTMSNKEFKQMMGAINKPKLGKNIYKLMAAYCPGWENIVKQPEFGGDALNFFRSLTLDAVEYRRQHGVRGNDMLQFLMDLQNSYVDPNFAVDSCKDITSKEKFDEIDIYANSFILMFGGYETLSTTIGYCMYEMALNENIQGNLRREVQEATKEFGKLNYNSLKKMSYMDAVIAETLRKYVSTSVNRECSQDYLIPGSESYIPKGTKIKIPVWSLHHDWRYFPNPEVFDPDRFVGENKKSLPKGVYLPFGDGPRSCIGKRFAEMEMKAALSSILLKYDIKPCTKTRIPLKFRKGGNLLQPECGIWVNLIQRD